MRCHLLDARTMEHPEPLERSIAILRSLDENGYLHMLHRQEPVPLLALAKEHRLNHLSRCDDHGIWHILITPNRDAKLGELLEREGQEAGS